MRGILLITAFLFFVSSAEAAYLDLSWEPNDEPDLAGYRIYYGTASHEYINFVNVGKVTSYRLDDLIDDVTYFIALTAYDRAGNESDFSGEVSAVGSYDETSVDSPSEAGLVVDSAKDGGCFVSAAFP